MPNTATIYLPLSTWVHVRVMANAGYTQKVTLTQENGTTTVLTGSGEHDTLLPNGDFGITTPASAGSPLGYRVTVSVQAQTRSGWQPSMVSQGSCSVMYYSLAMVVSEDAIDQDWNDAVAIFSWWVPPSLRNLDDLRKDSIIVE